MEKENIFPAILKTKICEFPGGYLTHFIYPQLDPTLISPVAFLGLSTEPVEATSATTMSWQQKGPRGKDQEIRAMTR